MKDKTYFLVCLIGCIILILGIMITIMLILTEIKGPEEEKADWNQYNAYIFSIIWPPSSCFSNNLDSEFCFNITQNLNITYNFTIHGFWPAYKSGRNPDTCNKNNDINITFDEDYEKRLSLFWPQLHSSEQNIWTNEYNKYGYCYNKRMNYSTKTDYKLYFDKALEIIDN